MVCKSTAKEPYRLDAHVHLGAWKHPDFKGLATQMETITQEMKGAGIQGVALTTSDGADNQTLLQVTRSCPLDLWLFLWASPHDVDGLRVLLEEHPSRVCGFKLHPSLERVPLNDRRWDEIFALAAAAQLKLMIHTGRWQETAGYALALERARSWPQIPMILSHAGGDTPDLCIGAATEVKRLGLENVMFDMAGVREHWALVRAMDVAGHQRYMMGSDYPLAPPQMYIAQIEAMRIPASWKDDLLGLNARRLLGEPFRAQDLPAVIPVARMPQTGVRSSTQTKVLITGAGGPLGVNVTRSLKMAKEPLYLLGTEANPYHRPLAETDCCLEAPRASEATYLGRMNEIIEQHGIDLLIPTHPLEVHVLSAVRDCLKVRLFLPEHRAIENGQDKYRSYELFRDAGVPVPRSMLIREPADLERAFKEFGSLPVWVRGSGTPGIGIGVASLACNKVAHAVSWVDHHRGWGGFMASEYLPGDNLTWLSLWYEGRLCAAQIRERLEYVIPHVSPSGITGAPAVTRTIRRPELHLLGEGAVRAVCPGLPHGVFFVDFKGSAEGKPKVTEINVGRFGTTIHFYTMAGFNFPELAVNLALKGPWNDEALYDPIAEDIYWLRTLDCVPC